MENNSPQEPLQNVTVGIQPASVLRQKFFKPQFFLSAIVLVLSLFSLAFYLTGGFGRNFPKKLASLNEGSLKDGSTGASLSDEDMQKYFTGPLEKADSYKDPNKAKENFIRFGDYLLVYNQLVGQYYGTRDPKILKTAKELKEKIKVEFDNLYLVHERDNPGAWDITE